MKPDGQGMDPGSKRMMWTALTKVLELGQSIVLTSHRLGTLFFLLLLFIVVLLLFVVVYCLLFIVVCCCLSFVVICCCLCCCFERGQSIMLTSHRSGKPLFFVVYCNFVFICCCLCLF